MAIDLLKSLFTELDRCEQSVPLQMLCDRLGQLDLCAEDLRQYVRFGADGYRRNLVRLGPGYVALVLCWRPGQASPIHDHQGSACGVRVLEGVATETRYQREQDGKLVEVEQNIHQPATVCGTFDADIHTVSNDQSAGRDLITLHVYTPPMREFRSYSLESPEVRVCVDREVLAEERRRAAARARGGAESAPGAPPAVVLRPTER